MSRLRVDWNDDTFVVRLEYEIPFHVQNPMCINGLKNISMHEHLEERTIDHPSDLFARYD